MRIATGTIRPFAHLLLIGVVLALVVAVNTIPHPVLFSNWTPSMPKGIYLYARRPLEPGTIVFFPATSVNDCGLHVPAQYLVKRIAFTAGTRIIVNKTGLFADGKLVAARVAPIGLSYTGILTANQVVVLGESPRSFDSRYFGPVPTAGLLTAIPLITWR